MPRADAFSEFSHVPARRVSPLAVGLVIFAGFPVAYGAATSAYVQVMRRISPEAVLRVDPRDPSALNRRNMVLISQNGMKDEAKRALIARNALISAQGQFFNPGALGSLALIKDIDGNKESAFHYFAVASQLSRRDQFAELWLGSYYLDKRRVPQALDHFDRLLRVTPQTAQVLNPILTRTLANRANAAAFRPYFAKPPPWFSDFLRQAMQDDKALLVLTDILTTQGTKLPDKPVYRAIESETLGWLVQRGDYDRAQKLLAIHGPEMLLVPKSLAFGVKDRDSAAGPFGWRVGTTEGLSGDFESSGNPKQPVRFRAAVSSLERGVVLYKAITLKPGKYRVGFGYRIVDHGRDATASWRGFCLDGGTRLFETPIDVDREKGRAEAVMTIPANCPAQQMQLLVAGGEVYPGLEMLLDQPVLARD